MVNKYLGVSVKDIGKKGLSNKKEFEKIMLKIVKDLKNNKIKYNTYKGRLLLLYRLTYKKNNSNLKLSNKTLNDLRKRIKNLMKIKK